MRETQREKVLKYASDFGSISSLETMRELGVMRLASRISEIKKMGYVVEVQTETAKNRYGEPTRYARYKIGEKKC